MSLLLEALREKQRAEKLSTLAFARKLGLSEGCLIHLYQGRRQLGLRCLHAVLTTYPDLTDLILQYIGTDGKHGHPKSNRG